MSSNNNITIFNINENNKNLIKMAGKEQNEKVP